MTTLEGDALHKISQYLTGESYPFNQADALWTSFQGKIANYVNQNGGTALAATQSKERPDWQQIKDVIDGREPLSTLSSDCSD